MGYVARGLRAMARGERRASPASEAGWEWLSSPRAAGLNAPTVEGSLALPAVWACVRVLSETIASLPLVLYRRDGERRARATDHPLYERLHDQANPEQTAMDLRELLTAHVATWGNGFAEIEWSRGGAVRALWPLRPDKIQVKRRGGELVYAYTMPTGRTFDLAWHQVMHLRGLGGDGVMGYSPVRMAMVAVALGMATEEFGARFFANGARPGVVLTHPGALSDKAKVNIRKSWEAQHEGLENSHRLAILEEGMKAEQIGVPPEEAQFLETRNFQAEEIARIYRVPPHKIALLNKATFSNIEHQSIEFVTDTIMPWLVRFEQAMRRDLLTPAERQTLYVEHLVTGLLRGDTASRYTAYATGRQWGWLSVNDIRRLENMEPVDDGDVYLQPLNMVPAGSAPPEAEPAKPTRAQMLPLVEDAVRRVVSRGAADVRRGGVRRLAEGREAWETWSGALARTLGQALGEMLEPAARAFDLALDTEALGRSWGERLAGDLRVAGDVETAVGMIETAGRGFVAEG